MKRIALSFLIAALPAIGWAGDGDEPKPDQVAASNEFALELYSHLAAADGNLFVSPLSISTALAMTWAGARGETAAEMAEALHLVLPPDELHTELGALLDGLQAGREERGYELHIANALWGQQGTTFSPQFIDINEQCYGAGLRIVDFIRQTEQARLAINEWVEQKTNERIKDLIARGILTTDTRLVLTNAIYFLADWAMPFEKHATRNAPFTRHDGTRSNVPTMHDSRRLRYAEAEDIKVLELPYKNNELSMLILLPDKHDGLPALEKQLSAAFLQGLIGSLKHEQVQVALPKFTFESSFRLNDTLKAMGMKKAFDPNSADFSGMTTDEQLFISAVVHKTFVKVDEKGTEAAAATAVIMAKLRAPMEPKQFRADHPFLFIIRDNRSGIVLFAGRLMEPAAGG